jgi:hypothetical protein
MYSYDTNINTATERQADRMHAVRAVGAHQAHEQANRSWAPDGAQQTSRVSAKLTVALAAAAPVVLVLAWGLMAR